jgi:hypothetical protein
VARPGPGRALLAAGLALALSAGEAPAQRIETVPLDDPADTDGTLLPNGARSRVRTAVPGDADDGDRFAVAPFRTPEPEPTAEPIALGETERLGGARLRVLDMISGETATIEVGVGERVEHRRLSLVLGACVRPQSGTTGDLAALEIVDRRRDGEGSAFEGWMFADSPALSALDHPRYDVWLIACIAASAGEGEGSDQKSAGLPSASSSSAR